jgi:hypothetical protein
MRQFIFMGGDNYFSANIMLYFKLLGKLRQFTVRQTLWQMAVCAWPGNLGRRDRLRFWYERPEAVES